jgi:ComF family protein
MNGRPLNSEGLCRLCAAGVTTFDTTFSCGDYDGALRDLIHLYKYHRVRPLSVHFGRLLARGFPRDQRFDAIVPVPQHWMKYLMRGFDHIGKLAAEVSRRTGVPVLRALRKIRHTPAQAGLTRAKRRKNVTRAFAARPEADVRGLNLLLLDDVFTTGATANAAAAALKKAGAAHVSILTLARADRYGDWRAGRPARMNRSFEGELE